MTALDVPSVAAAIPPAPSAAADCVDVALREQLSNLQGLLGISMMMTERGDEQDILDLATTAVPSLGRCRIEGVYLFDLGWRSTAGAGNRHEVRADVQAQLTTLPGDGGEIAIRGLRWSWAFQLRSSQGRFGYLVVSACAQPPDAELFMLRVLAQQTGIALANARLHARERASAEQLRAANCRLAGTVEALERKTAIHDRLTRAAIVSEGVDGIAAAVHELTGFAVAVEDGNGNLLAWAGPGDPNPLGKHSTARRERVLVRALREGRPIRAHGRLLTVVQPRADVLGVLALVDPGSLAGEPEQVALEHGATVLAMELARLHSLAETELRLGHDTVAEVLDGTNPGAAIARARALGYDLDRPHRVVLVDADGSRVADDGFFDLVRRAARATALGSLLLPRDGAVVVLSAAEPAEDGGAAWERLRVVVEAELAGGRCRVGVSGVCGSVGEFPRAYREAQLALRLRDVTGEIDHAVVYDRLGIYQLLAEVQDIGAVERHARQWLGALIDYDTRRHSELVATLSRFLECGGSYDATARSLQVGRSTLRYRLRRIREISGHDHSDPDTRFNLQLATRGWRTLRALAT